MSLAPKLSSYERVSSGAAAPQQVPRDTRRRQETKAPVRRHIGRWVLVGLVLWLCAMAPVLWLVHLNSQARAEEVAITKIREELNQVLQQNLELKSDVEQAVSVATIERWAAEHGMVRPTTVKVLPSVPEAQAIRADGGAAAQPVAKQPEAKGFWGAVWSYVAHVGSAIGISASR